MTDALPGSSNPKSALLKGAAWTVGTRWAIKAIGFINTIVVARLVAPQDYGLVAMAFLVVGLTQALIDFGASTALLRQPEVSRDQIDSAWTLTVIQGLLVGLLMLAVSPLAGLYFKEPRLVQVLWVMAACQVVSGFANIGLTLARKNLQFAIEAYYLAGNKVLSVVATMVAAYYLRDYRALMVGVVTGYASIFILSFLLHSYRPRWNTSKIPEIWAVTKWLMLAGVGGFFLRKSDELIAARIGTTAEFGMYNVGADLGQLPTGELGPAMLRAFLPVLSSIQGDVARTNAAVLKTLAAVNTITLPVGMGFAALALPATQLVLGNQWLNAAPFVACFALAGAMQFVMSPLNTLLVLRGHTRTQSHVVWTEFVLFVLASVVLAPQMHLLGLVWARIAASIGNAAITALCTQKHCHLPLASVIQAIWRPLAGAVAMNFLVHYVGGLVPAGAWQLVAGVLCGTLFYSAWCLVSWFVVGKPEGFESTVFDFLARRSYS